MNEIKIDYSDWLISDEEALEMIKERVFKQLLYYYYFNKKKLVGLSELKKDVVDLVNQYTIKELRTIMSYFIEHKFFSISNLFPAPFVKMKYFEILQDRKIVNFIIGIERKEIMYYKTDNGFVFEKDSTIRIGSSLYICLEDGEFDEIYIEDSWLIHKIPN